jgi:hypothetical protein
MLGNSLEYRIRIKDHPESGWLSDQRVVVSSVTEERLEEKVATVRNCYPDQVVIVTIISETIVQQIPAKPQGTERGVQANELNQNCGGNQGGLEAAS